MNIHLIAQIYLPEPSGVFAAELADHWNEIGHRVTVWTGSRGGSFAGPEVVSISRTYDRKTLLGRGSSQLRFFGRAAAALARRARNDAAPELFVVVGSPALPTFLPAFARPGSSARVVHWIYDLYPEALLALRPHDLAVRTLARPTAIALNAAWQRADAVVAISPAMAAHIRRRAPDASVHSIPLWAPTGVEPCSDRAIELRRARGIAEDAFVVMYHGNLGLAYDFEPIFGAARALSGDRRVVFVIVGEGAQRGGLVERVADERLANVRIFPSVDATKLSKSLAMGDCHIVGVRDGWDGLAFPSKFITAIAAGRPVLVVGSQETELAAIVNTRACGASVRRDGEALASAVRSLCEHASVAEVQGTAARSTYEAMFDRGKALARWDALISSLGEPRKI